MTAPAAGATFAAPATIKHDGVGQRQRRRDRRVDFFAGNTPIGSDTTAPYAVSWNNVPAGTTT